MTDAFAKVIGMTLDFEGGYRCDPVDPGGETNFGISKRSYPDLDIAKLTREDAIAIYRHDFWDRPRLGELPPLIAEKLFDLSVNMGLGPATKILQRALIDMKQRVTADGVLGPITRATCKGVDERNCVLSMCEEAAAHYHMLVTLHPALEKFIHGWLRRAQAMPPA